MRLAKVLCIMALVAMSAAAANAGSVLGDPKLTVNGKPGGNAIPLAKHSNYLSCPAGDICFTNKVTNPATPIMIPFSLLNNGTDVLFYEGNGTITSPANGSNPRIWIEITGIPTSDQFSQIFNCTSDVFTSQTINGVSGICGGSNTVATSSIYEFNMYGGTLTPGEMFDVTLTSTPEASTVVLFLSLIPVVFFATKRWNARQTA